MKEERPIYLNDPDGRKEPKLKEVEVLNPAELVLECSQLLCRDIITAKPEQTFYAQNVGAHWAYITRAIRNVSPEIQSVYLSTHEIKWMEETLTKKGHKPDATFSNYRRSLDPLAAAPFYSDLVPFESFRDIASQITEPSIFFISHISRLTGEIADLEAIYKAVKGGNSNSILVVDGAQSIGGYKPIQIEGNCDAYIALSSKFLGAEPNVGIAFFSDDFFDAYIRENGYPKFQPELYARDLYSLRDNLKHPQYKTDFMPYIRALKEDAVKRIAQIDPSVLFCPPTQAPNFLTLNFGSTEDNIAFVNLAQENGIIVSETSNHEWTVKLPENPVVRVGLSVRTEPEDVDILVNFVRNLSNAS